MATRKKAKAKKATSKKKNRKKTTARAGARGRTARKAVAKSRKSKAKKAAPKAKRRAKSGVKAKAKTRAKARPARKAAQPKARPAGPASGAVRSVPPLSSVQSLAIGTVSAAPAERPIGTVTHYYTDLAVAIVRLDSGALREGDTVRIKGHTSDFTQPVESMEIDRLRVDQAYPGQAVGLRVREHARENDVVYKVEG